MAPLKAPRRARFGAFVHVKARFYQNYRAMVLRAARRRRGRAIDCDSQKSANGTPWAFHWPTIGKNKLRDRKGVWGKNTRIDTLTDAQILDRLRGPRGQHPFTVAYILNLAASKDVRVEVEVKTTISETQIKKLLADPDIARMNRRGDLQFKTLAFMGAPTGPVNRLRPIQNAGGVTILSFTGFRKRGISKAAAWPVTDYVRGRAKWIA